MSLKIEDIAKKAGVSKTAVSFALNDKPGISNETKEKILNIVREYGYMPKSLVKSNGVSLEYKTILLLSCSRTEITSVDFSTKPFYAELIRGIEKRVNESGYDLWLKNINIDENFKKEISTLLSSKSISGILLVATDMHCEDVKFIQQLNKNIVVLDSYFEALDIDCVLMDNFQGAYCAAEYLIKLGHRSIGYIQSVDRIYNFEMRKKGFELALQKECLSLDSDNVYSVVPAIDSVADDIKDVFNVRDDKITALFAENDYIAIGAIKYLQGKGINVPEDISIIGFDDIEMSSVITPELTTLRVPKEKMAIIAVDRLRNKMENEDEMPNINHIIGVNLTTRKSCKPVK